MRELIVVVDGRPPSPNRLHGHWAVVAKIKREWREKAKDAALAAAIDAGWMVGMFGGAIKAARPMGFAEATVVIVAGDRRDRDQDNGQASLKAVWDGIVDSGVLVDDGSKHLHATVEYQYEKGRNEVRITLREGALPGTLGI